MDKQWIAEYTAKLKEIFENGLYLESKAREVSALSEQLTVQIDKIIARIELLDDKL